MSTRHTPSTDTRLEAGTDIASSNCCILQRVGGAVDLLYCPLHRAAPDLLAALKEAMPLIDAAWTRAIMDTDAPMEAKLAQLEKGSPEAILARAAIAKAEEKA